MQPGCGRLGPTSPGSSTSMLCARAAAQLDFGHQRPSQLGAASPGRSTSISRARHQTRMLTSVGGSAGVARLQHLQDLSMQAVTTNASSQMWSSGMGPCRPVQHSVSCGRHHKVGENSGAQKRCAQAKADTARACHSQAIRYQNKVGTGFAQAICAPLGAAHAGRHRRDRAAHLGAAAVAADGARRQQRHARRRRRRPRRRLRQAGRQEQRAKVPVERVQDAERRGLLRVLLRVAVCVHRCADCSPPVELVCRC